MGCIMFVVEAFTLKGKIMKRTLWTIFCLGLAGLAVSCGDSDDDGGKNPGPGPDPEPDPVTVTLHAEGLQGTAASLRTLADETFEALFDENGTAVVELPENTVVATLTTASGATVRIGRRGEGEISFRYADGVTFRDAAEGCVPVGIAEELMLLGRDETTLAGKYRQEADLHLDGIDWVPVGADLSNPFTGAYDGAGKKIYGLTVDRAEKWTGLFGAMREATLTDVTIASGSIRGSEWVGAVAGRFEGNSATVAGCANYASVEGDMNVGGLFGQVAGAAVENCENHGAVQAAGDGAGGVAGYGMSARITGCRNHGDVVAASTAGGICAAPQSGTLSDCVNLGTVTAETGAGGIAGTSSRVTIDGCRNEGGVALALVSSAERETLNSAGGIAGTANSTISACENSGSVAGSAEIRSEALGGIVGVAGEGAEVSDCINRERAVISNGYTRVGGIIGVGNRFNADRCENHAAVAGEQDCVGGIVGQVNTGNVTYAVNRGAISGAGYVGGICGYEQEGGKIRMSLNEGAVSGTGFTGGIVGSAWGTVSASVNRASVTGEGEYTGGVAGSVAGQYGFAVASYNEGAVTGTNGVGGVVGGVNQNALVQAVYSVGEVQGTSKAGGVCGEVLDEYSTFKDCYWSRVPQGLGSADPERTGVSRFDDGTEAPAGAAVGWPEETMEHWGISATGTDKNWWKTLGERGTEDYPMLFWEE